MRMRPVGVFAVLMVAAAGCGHGLELEAGPVVPVFPDDASQIGCVLSLHLWDVPDGWLAVGGHKLFVDGLVCDETATLGASVSLLQARQDNRLRLGVALTESGDGRRWTVYLRHAIPLELRW